MQFIKAESIDESDPIWGLAINQSRKSEMKFKIGAVIIKRGRVLGFGNNRRKTHPKFGSKQHYKTLHSEGDALWCAKKLGNDVNGATIIVYRRDGLNSKPCEHCQKLLNKAGIKKVIYTNETRIN